MNFVVLAGSNLLRRSGEPCKLAARSKSSQPRSITPLRAADGSYRTNLTYKNGNSYLGRAIQHANAPIAKQSSLRSKPVSRLYSTPAAATEAVATTNDAFVASAVVPPPASVIQQHAAPSSPPSGLLWDNEGFTRLFDPINWAGVTDPIYYFFQGNLELIHNLTGLPWWGTAVAFALAVRLLTFPFQVRQQRLTAATARIQPQLLEIRQKYMYTDPKSDSKNPLESAQRMSVESRELMKKHGVGPLSALANAGPQAFAMISGFIVLRSIANDNSATLHQLWLQGGDFWFTNLCAADPTYILPILSTITTGSLLLITPMPQYSRKTVYMISTGIMALSFAFTMGFPSIIHLFWTGSSSLTLVSTYMLLQPAARKFFNIPAIDAKAEAAAQPKPVLFDSPLSNRPKPGRVAVPPATETTSNTATESTSTSAPSTQNNKSKSRKTSRS